MIVPSFNSSQYVLCTLLLEIVSLVVVLVPVEVTLMFYGLLDFSVVWITIHLAV